MVKRTAKTCNIAAKQFEKEILRVLPPTFKPVLQLIGLLPASCMSTDSDWIKLRGSHCVTSLALGR